jgi:hypothetical protein
MTPTLPNSSDGGLGCCRGIAVGLIVELIALGIVGTAFVLAWWIVKEIR